MQVRILRKSSPTQLTAGLIHVFCRAPHRALRVRPVRRLGMLKVLGATDWAFVARSSRLFRSFVRRRIKETGDRIHDGMDAVSSSGQQRSGKRHIHTKEEKALARVRLCEIAKFSLIEERLECANAGDAGTNAQR